MASKSKETNENEEIRNIMIKSYKILEEKLENINENIDRVEAEIHGPGGLSKKEV